MDSDLQLLIVILSNDLFFIYNVAQKKYGSFPSEETLNWSNMLPFSEHLQVLSSDTVKEL